MRLDQVRSDWTALGSADPLWAVLVSPDGRNRRWSPEDFLATGREEIAGVLAHVEAIGLHPRRGRALDLGCGAGRLTHALAAQFEHVVGVDISPTMLETARSLVTDERCEFVENTEPHLHRFADDSFDLAVSSLVLQHLPPDVADQLLAELVRVVRPGGVVVVQVAESPDRSARGLLTRVLPRPAMRWAQQRILGYPAPMDMWATPFTTVARVAAAGGARIADAVADPMYGGHWRYRRYYLSVAGEPPAPEPADLPVGVGQAPPATPPPPPEPQASAAPAAPPNPEVDAAPRSASAATAAWLRARPERPVWVAAFALAVIQTVVRGVLAYRGTFYIDDFAFTGRAAQYGLSPHFLFHPYNSHVMPGSFAWVWLSTKLAPLSYAPVATVDVLLQLLLAVQFYRLLRDLFGTRPAILVPYAVYLFTPVTLPAFVWWAAALNQLPMQLAMVIALRCQLAYLRTGRRSRGVLGAVAVVGGLAFSEKTLLVVPLLVAVTVLYFQTGGIVHRIRRVAVRHRAVWLAHLVVAVPYTAWYLIAVPSPVSSRQAGHEVVSLADTSFREALLPGLLGGPWSWRPIGWAGALAGTSSVASWICFAGVALLVAASIRARRGAVLGWLIVLCYALANFVLLLVSRATFVGAVIGDEYRYITDVAAVAVIGGALALIPLRDGPWVAADPVRLERRSSAPDGAAPAASALVDTVRVLTVPWRGMAGAAVLAALVTASALVSTVRYDRYWHDNPVRPYLAALKHDLGTAHGPVVLDEGVPEDIAWGLLYPYNLESKVFRPLSDAPSYLAPGQVVEQLDVVAPDGHLRRALVRGPKNLPGKVSNCGWLVKSAPVTVPLFGRTVPGDWVLRMGYIASADATTTLTAGVTRVDVPVRRGLNTLFVRVSGTVTSIRLSGFTGSTSLCTADVTVGTPVAVPGTTVP